MIGCFWVGVGLELLYGYTVVTIYCQVQRNIADGVASAIALLQLSYSQVAVYISYKRSPHISFMQSQICSWLHNSTARFPPL